MTFSDLTSADESDAMNDHKPLRVALLGCGVVGSAVARRLVEHADDLTARVGVPLEIVGIAVRRAGRDRSDVPVDPSLFTTDAADLVTRADIVVETVGGIDPARELLLSAMAHGASVVTANKALLAEDGPTLYAAADAAGVDLYYEAAVAGAIPLLRPIRESLAGDDVRKILGIVNGTTADVEGFDAAAKAAILASLAFHTRVAGRDVHREGITEVTASDIAAAKEMDCVVKLLAIAEKASTDDGEGISVRVHPVMIPRSHPLASVREAFNAVFVEASAAGQLMFYGRGAGGDPTSSAVLGDLVAVARHKVNGSRGPGESAYADLPVLDFGRSWTRYHISLDVEDRPGVLAQVATAFASHDVSIETVRQRVVTNPDSGGPRAELIVVTHRASEAALNATVETLSELDSVADVVSVMRVEGA